MSVYLDWGLQLNSPKSIFFNSKPARVVGGHYMLSMQSSQRTDRTKGRIVSSDEEEPMASQKDIFAQQDDDEDAEMETASEHAPEAGDDLLTQARTQIQGKYIQRTAKRKAGGQEAAEGDEEALDGGGGEVEFNPKPSEKSVYQVRQAYGALNNEINRTGFITTIFNLCRTSRSAR